MSYITPFIFFVLFRFVSFLRLHINSSIFIFKKNTYLSN